MKRSDMKIFIVGAGHIGTALAAQLSRDGHEVTVIDREEEVIRSLADRIDAIGYEGNGASYNTLDELNAQDADILIAVTNSDEMNILSCFTAHMLGARHTIARIRDEDYASQNHFYKDKLGISMIINPELATAYEIFRTLRFPSATRVEVFAGGKAELVETTISETSPLCGRSLIDINRQMGINLLFCVVVRDGEPFVPKGDTEIRAGDIVYLTGAASEFHTSFKKLKMAFRPVTNVMIAGNDRITSYLGQLLVNQNVKVTIVDDDKEICERFTQRVKKAAVMNEDALRYFDLMTEQDLANTDAFIAITENDEYNLIAAMYAESQGIGKVISRISAKSRLKVLPKESKINIVSREDVAADRILGYARALLNAEDKNAVESLYRLMDGRIEFIEFKVSESDKHIHVPLKELKIRRNILISGIIRNSRMIIPRGDDVLLPYDTALVVTIGQQIASLDDIYE
ncbi:MAG: Trk system potassium transporter TrkA [Lachnospiraceae bacterium]|nr:Trk system potassium transporter TrkA [Lachnospiraceae bacterium]